MYVPGAVDTGVFGQRTDSVDIEAALKDGTLTTEQAVVLQERQLRRQEEKMQAMRADASSAPTATARTRMRLGSSGWGGLEAIVGQCNSTIPQPPCRLSWVPGVGGCHLAHLW